MTPFGVILRIIQRSDTNRLPPAPTATPLGLLRPGVMPALPPPSAWVTTSVVTTPAGEILRMPRLAPSATNTLPPPSTAHPARSIEARDAANSVDVDIRRVSTITGAARQRGDDSGHADPADRVVIGFGNDEVSGSVQCQPRGPKEARDIARAVWGSRDARHAGQGCHHAARTSLANGGIAAITDVDVPAAIEGHSGGIHKPGGAPDAVRTANAIRRTCHRGNRAFGFDPAHDRAAVFDMPAAAQKIDLFARDVGKDQVVVAIDRKSGGTSENEPPVRPLARLPLLGRANNATR